METKDLILLKEELMSINGGIAPLLVWLGYAVATGVVGYFTYEVTDGLVKGFSSDECAC